MSLEYDRVRVFRGGRRPRRERVVRRGGRREGREGEREVNVKVRRVRRGIRALLLVQEGAEFSTLCSKVLLCCDELYVKNRWTRKRFRRDCRAWRRVLSGRVGGEEGGDERRGWRRTADIFCYFRFGMI